MNEEWRGGEKNLNKLLQNEIKRTWNCVGKVIKKGRYLVTGAGGNIGRYLVLMLLENPENQVIALMHHANKDLDRLWDITERRNLKIVVGDICDSNLNIETEKIDYVFHLAGIVNNQMCIEYPEKVLETAMLGTKNILSFCVKNSIKKFCFFSTASVYGKLENVTDGAKESDRGFIDFCDISNSYAMGKQLGEMLCSLYECKYHLSILCVRPYHVITPDILADSSSMLGDFFESVSNGRGIVLKTTGSQKRNLIYVFDALAVVLYMFFAKDIHVVNVGNPDGTLSVMEVAEIMSKIGQEKYHNDQKVCVRCEESIKASNGIDMVSNLEKMCGALDEYKFVSVEEAITRCISMKNESK